MSGVFFRELELPESNVNLGIGSGPHGWQTARMLIGIEEVLQADKPDWVVVYGDTNSTLAGALAAAKLHIPVAHVEAGLRSYNRKMPEEHNRVVTDHLSSLLFCPTETAVDNLRGEGLTNAAPPFPLVVNVGDVMYDSILHNIRLAENRSDVLRRLELKPKGYALATLHRAENADDPHRLQGIFLALDSIAMEAMPVLVPLHPRTRQTLSNLHSCNPRSALRNPQLVITDPVSYLDMLLLEMNASLILTDSGGVQKEAYWFKVPCITLREETEWTETVESGWNVLAGSDPDRIVRAVKKAGPGQPGKDCYGDGHAAEKIINLLATM